MSREVLDPHQSLLGFSSTSTGLEVLTSPAGMDYPLLPRVPVATGLLVSHPSTTPITTFHSDAIGNAEGDAPPRMQHSTRPIEAGGAISGPIVELGR